MATSKTKHVQTLILGGGITGLATAYALQKRGMSDYLVLEANPVPGGLCATTTQNGYQFDFGGHFLHLHTPKGKQIVQELLGTNLKKHARKAFIYTNGMKVPYPFQSNLWALFPEVRAICVEGLKRIEPQTPQNFEQWCLQSFGWGLYEAFFRPYNEKLWGKPLRELSCDWCGPFVPAPARKQMLQSATQKPAHPQGYNAAFYYPKKGGIGALIQALVKQINPVRLNSRLTRLDLKNRTAWINGKEKITFDHVVNTLPLPDLVACLEGNATLKKSAQKLESRPVTIYHLALARKLEPFHWIYCPDPAQPFYRVGMVNSFYPEAVPDKETSLLWVELPGQIPHTPDMEQKIWNGLYQKGLVNEDDVSLFSAWQDVPHAYVLFNAERAQRVPALLAALEKQGCYCVGRYGRWEYSFMETSLLQGDQIAQNLANLV
ncbi:MAG: FAD-dependent oxidoreductase [Elusimicrobiaceae bacterium]|nr:FAD-dependent oxidoreductase [Elusimicrobiaceae bacterium]